MAEVNKPADENRIRSLLEQIRKITDMQLGPNQYKLYLFGSWARGDAHEGSDIDIAIDAGKPIDNETFRQTKAFIASIRTLRTIDVVDLNDVSREFKTIILREGVVIQ